MKRYNFEQKRIAPTQIKNDLQEGKKVNVRVPGRKLISLLTSFKGVKIKMKPTNKATKEIMEEACMGAVVGFGVAAIAKALGYVAGPGGWLLMGGGAALGFGLGYYSSKYKISIKRVKDTNDDTIFDVQLLPAA